MEPKLLFIPRRFLPYLVAVGTVAIATLINIILYRPSAAGEDTHYFALLAAVFVSGLYGGLWPGFLATVLATFSSAFFSLAPAYSLEIESREAVQRLSLFFVEGLVISLLLHVVRTADAVDILPKRHTRYLAIVMPPAVAVLMKTILAPDLAYQVPFAFNYAAVCVSAWLGGLSAGVATTVVLALITRYFFLPPYHSFGVSSNRDALRLALFVFEGLLLALLNAQHLRLRRIAHSLSAHAWRNLLSAQTSADDARAMRAVSRDTIWQWEPETNTIVRTPSWRDSISSALPENENFETWVNRMHPEDRGRTVSKLWDALRKSGEECQYAYRLRRSDGEYTAVSDHAFIVRDAQWKPIRVIGRSAEIGSTSIDVRLPSPEDLQFARMFDHSPIAVLMVDNAFRILFSNRAARTMLRTRGSALARTDFRTFVQAPVEAGVLDQLSSLFNWRQLSLDLELLLVRQTGETFRARFHAAVVAEFEQGSIGCLVLLDEISN